MALDAARAQGELPDGVHTDELARVLAALAMDALPAWAQGDSARLRSRIQTRADVVLAGAQTVNQERAPFAVTDRVPARSRPCRPCIHSDPAMAAMERPVGADGWTMEYRQTIIGPRTADQFTGSLRAVEIQLESAVLRELDRIFSGPGGPAPESYAW